MANEYVGGNTQWSTPGDITIGATAYVCDSWSVESPTSKQIRKGSTGLPIGQRITDENPTASATIQIPTAGTEPTRYQLSTYDSVDWVVESVSKATEAEGIRKCTVNFSKVIA